MGAHSESFILFECRQPGAFDVDFEKNQRYDEKS